jgi:hypothetical protein
MPTDIRHNLERYLAAEKLLNDFFAAFDFCFPQCIQMALGAADNKPVAGCCRDKYHMLFDLEHPAFDLLRRERERLYGTPQDHAWSDPVSPCEYHDPLRGCVLPTHKSPVCIAFLCRKAIDRLRERYDIYTYDYLGFYYAMEWILTGDLSDPHYVQFRDDLCRMTLIIRESPLTAGR